MDRLSVVLGKKYRDRVSGFEGVATSRHDYLNGCVRITLTATQLRDGKPLEGMVFDIEDLVYVDEGVVAHVRPTGGPGEVPAARFEPAGRR